VGLNCRLNPQCQLARKPSALPIEIKHCLEELVLDGSRNIPKKLQTTQSNMNKHLLQCLIMASSCRSCSCNDVQLLLARGIWLPAGLLFAPSPGHGFLSGWYWKSSICNIPNTSGITYNYMVSEGMILGKGKFKGLYSVVLDLKDHILVDHHVVQATYQWQLAVQWLAESAQQICP
jgi:hypothetical protein